MQGIRISSQFRMNLKSALRNLQSAIVLCAMLLALWSSAQASADEKNPANRDCFFWSSFISVLPAGTT